VSARIGEYVLIPSPTRTGAAVTRRLVPPSLALLTRFARLVSLAGLALTLPACTSFQPTGATQPTPAKVARIEARSGALNVALRASDASPTFQYCRARSVQGTVLRVDGDTVIFSQLTSVEAMAEGDRACRSTGVARLVYSPGSAQVFEERTDKRRSIGVGIMLAVVGVMMLGI
jgi:hypothetical protein